MNDPALPAPVVPKPPSGFVRRPRLEELLDRGVRGPLTLVSAPAGTGKTVLASTWLTGRHAAGSAVWAPLNPVTDGTDDFWQQVVTGLTEGEDRNSRSTPRADPLGPDSAVDTVLHVVLDRPSPVVLMLDCDTALPADLAQRLHLMIQRARGRLRVVLLTREDPPLPLHRYRLAGTVTEIRMADLAFQPDEALALMTGMGVEITPPALDAVVRRTHGWAAGLRMAGTLLAHSADREQAARRLAGDSGQVAEYLLAEVLETQPPAIRRLLLDTGVADLLRPGLASALSGPQADRALSFLVQGNAFLEELPERPGSYRYHHLFRELLRAQLAYESPQRWVEQHRVAAGWLAGHGVVDEAVRHCLTIEEWEAAARYLIDDLVSLPMLLGGRPSALVTDTVADIPRAAQGPAVALLRAVRTMASGDVGDASATATAARRAVEGSTGETPEAWPAGALTCAALDLLAAARADDPDGVAVTARTALRLVPMQEPRPLSARPEIEPLIHLRCGDGLVRAGRLREAAEEFEAASRTTGERVWAPGRIEALGQGALLAAWRGDLRYAAGLAAKAARLASSTGAAPATPRTTEAVLAYIDCERYELVSARRHAERAAQAPAHGHDPLASTALILTRSRLRHAGGDLRGALNALGSEGAALPGWLQDRIDLERAALLVAENQPARAAEVLAQLSDPETIAAGRDLLEEGEDALAGGRLPGEAQLTTADRQVRLVRAAVRHVLAGREGSAVRDLERALALAAPELSRRVFLDAPDVLWQVLRRHEQLWVRHAWLTERDASRQAGGLPRQRPAVPSGPGEDETGAIYEPLTEKEAEVLDHLAELLTTEEIAAAMFISVNTVRTHVRNILRKLAASRRNEAVRRARALKLIRS